MCPKQAKKTYGGSFMKKIFSALLVLTMLLLVIPVNAFANCSYNYLGGIDVSQYTNSELDLSKYTLEDIRNMSPEEYAELVNNFERVYDPYNSYNSEQEASNNSQINDNSFDQQWTSGGKKIITGEEYSGSHELISTYASGILSNDKGFFSNDALAVLVIILQISLASKLPDKDEVGVIAFSGHFYDPDEGCNYAGSSKNTAKTNATSHYNKAITAAKQGDMEKAYEEIGRCLHYVQDACEPHHASNIHAATPNSGATHSFFEKEAHKNIEKYLDKYTSINSSNYSKSLSWSTDTLVHNAAVEAKVMSPYVSNPDDLSKWDHYANLSMKNAARYSAMILYKFGQNSSVPFFS